jgi:hypothetical protein
VSSKLIAPLVAAGVALLILPCASRVPGGSMTYERGGASNPMGLLMRSEVQKDLHLSLKQKNALSQVLGESRAEAEQRIVQVMQNRRRMSREERMAAMQQARAQMPGYVGELPGNVKAILKPEQLDRLHQLDLQWRGPLALADPKVAQEAKTTPEHRSQIGVIVATAQAQQSTILQEAIQQWRQSAGPQGGPVPDFLSSPSSPVRKQTDAIRKDAEEQVLALLTGEEAAGWKAAQGEDFTFRKDRASQDSQGMTGR